MKFFLCYCLVGLLTSCATTKPLPARLAAEQDVQRSWQPQPTRLDSTSGARIEPGSQADFIRSIFEGHPPVVQVELEAEPDSLRFVKVPKSPQKPTEKRRLFGLLPAKKPASASETQLATAQNATQMPRKCKGCTIVYGNATVAGKKAQVAAGDGTTATNIGKAKGPTAVGDSASAIDNTKQGQRGGSGASGPGAHATATTVKPKFPWANVIGGVVAFAFLIWMVFFGGGGMLAGLVRRKSSTTNQA
jgi:hypothetical protein